MTTELQAPSWTLLSPWSPDGGISICFAEEEPKAGRGFAELPGVTPPSRVKPRAFPHKEKLPESGVEAFLHPEITNTQTYPLIPYIISRDFLVGRQFPLSSQAEVQQQGGSS